MGKEDGNRGFFEIMIIAGTGHRPDKLVPVGQNGYSDEVFWRLSEFLTDKLLTLAVVAPNFNINETTLITGMALGWDQALAEACNQTGIEYIAAVPFEGQESVWPSKAKERYASLLKRAKEVQIVSPGGYAAWKMQARNIWMVDRLGEGDKLLALWNKTPGGTANCVKYAESKGKTIVNCWEEWQEFEAIERGQT
jgi:uncharacterized phage-like protein YoqJ